MLIRLFKPADAEALAALYHSSVHRAGILDYSPQQVTAWSPSQPDPEMYLHRSRTNLIFVAEGDDGEPIGYGDLEPDGHIDHLYCQPDMIGLGVGSALYASIETAAKKMGIRTLYLEASEAARRLFERRGFSINARNDFILNEVPIHNYRMSKLIY